MRTCVRALGRAESRGRTRPAPDCFACPTHRCLDLDAGRDFEREIVVKVNVPEVLRAELARPGWQRELVAIGTNTDPYQWVEGPLPADAADPGGLA